MNHLVAPTNYFWLNPVAMQRFVETNGESLRQGWQNLQRDVKAKNILMVEPDAFTVGKDLATTPGKVVFRNRLLEVIHYTPTKAKVHETPIVIVTPWINKFYILDLNPKKSLVRYLLDQGLDVFITSWKNPGEEMRDVRFDDYLTEGIQSLVDTARGVSGAARVHAIGYCIGGTALTTYMAWANRHHTPEDVPVAHCTLFTTLVDFHKPGDIEVNLENLKVVSVSGDRATVKLRQHYRSANLSTSSNKTLNLMLQDGKWVIVQERVGG